ncbi:hypothetical protein P288_07710 [Salmonella enterica subsp. arizonae serovar 18:z4,z23:- str. CVM N7307]|nr:hypothetical protein CFSAN001921_22865 [Salmonella enterica subsp. enterica serovar Typhimurium var. 5- str. CFSAN001921]AGQ87723.1 hypothetical protein SE451236_03325 [Salmonella enterica subsp. enterica serovar 4,[5],12:i:- str. 08-1736]AGS65910.1 hypothetical protein I137_19420 [Salmonella enterica subsp. enterica serovar Pullorum str. S06004]AHU95020.1 hypothetical protein AU17_17445 [Salmonella enterica subsp. enterica serovar Enteritidis str. EC20110354]EQM36125.1 hypothetical protein 
MNACDLNEQERMPIYFKSAVFAHMLTGAFRFYD